MAKERNSTQKALVRGAVVVANAIAPSMLLSWGLSKTRIPLGYKALIQAGVGVGGGMLAIAGDMPNMGVGLIVGGLTQGVRQGAEAFQVQRYLGSPESRSALPAGTTSATQTGANVGAAGNTTTGT